MNFNNLTKRVSDYLQKDLNTVLADKPTYQLLFKYGLLLSGAGLVLMADVRHLISALVGVTLIGVGLQTFKRQPTVDDFSVRTIEGGNQQPVIARFAGVKERDSLLD